MTNLTPFLDWIELELGETCIARALQPHLRVFGVGNQARTIACIAPMVLGCANTQRYTIEWHPYGWIGGGGGGGGGDVVPVTMFTSDTETVAVSLSLL